MTSHVLIKNIKRSRLSSDEIFIFDLLDNMYIKNGGYLKMIPDKTSVSGYFEREFFSFHTEEPISRNNQLIINNFYVLVPLYNNLHLNIIDIRIIISKVFNNLYNTNYQPSYFY